MNIANLFQSVVLKRSQNIQVPTVPILALAVGLFITAGTSQAITYNWTNTTASTYDDPGAYNPTGGPGGSADTANFSSLTGSVTVRLTNNFVETGSLQFGSPTTGGASVTYTLDFGTNVFTGYNGPSGGSGSGFVFGQQGTSTIYIAVGTMYCTNANSLTTTRLTIGRNNLANTYVNLTNGNVVVGGFTVMANNAGASGCKLVISGANSYWSNVNAVSIGNVASANLNSVVVSNSASLCSMAVIQMGFQSPSHSNSVVVDTLGRVVAAGGITIGAGTGSLGNKMTVQGGGGVDNGARTIGIGSATSGTGNTLLIGSNGTVSNVTAVTVFTGNSLSLSGGLLRVSVAITNSSGTVGGSGTIAGDVVFTGTGTLSPSVGSLVGTLNATNNLTLVSTSTTIINLDKGQTGSNDLVNVVGTMTEAGTLTVNNAGAALVGGDTFKLFAIGSKTGDFAVTNLPVLTGTLVWDTTQLGSSGIISVALPPTITDPSPQAVLTNTDVTISTVVTGVPTPALQWQRGGVNVTNGPTGNGSTISGSTSATLTILNSQVADNGQYCLIASNVAGSVTNCMQLEVTVDFAAPLIGGLHDQNVIEPNSATFTSLVAGIPFPALQWQDNGANITDATNTSVTIPGVTFALDGHSYCIIASNSAGVATNCALLHVVVPPAIQTQPASLVVTQTQSATFTVVSTNGVPAPTFQWKFNNANIPNATNTSYTIASATPANAGTYKVVVANIVGSVTSTDATLTVNSTMAAALTPSNSAVNVCYDTPLYMAFDRTPVSTGTGKIQIFNVTNSITPVDTIDTFLGNIQSRTIGTETFNTFPVIITSNTVAIYPHLGVLSSNQTYYVTVDPGTFSETNGALFAGIASTNAWAFTTKLTGPADPNNIIVATNGSGDFVTVQGAVDFVPLNNGENRLINIRNGTYTEIVDTRTKSNITFRGQSRTGTVIRYTNNNNMNGSTHSRMSFKVFSNDISIENLTLVNTTAQGGSQAEALMIDNPSARFILNNAEVDSRQDTILANANTSQCYFYDSLVQGNFDYVWGGGNCYFEKCEFRTIPTANSYNLVATRTDTGTGAGAGQWPGWGVNQFTSNGFSFVHCKLTRSSTAVTNITLAGANGTANGQAAFLYCSMDVSNSNGYIAPTIASGVLSNELLWEFGNSNVDNTASASFGLVALTNGDDRLVCALDPTCWLNGWVPQLAPNILSGPTNLTVNSGQPAAFSVSATGIPVPSYQWLKAGTNLVGQTSATLNIAATVADDAGTYSVIVANGAGSVTNSAMLTVIPTPFEAWQQLYFGCTSCPQAAAGADPDGDGLSNQAEFLAGTDPTSSTSGLRITSTLKQGSDVTITWATAGGRTNILQATGGEPDGSYSTNNFADLAGSLTIITGSGDQSTNYTDLGGATNAPSRYYRIRLVP